MLVPVTVVEGVTVAVVDVVDVVTVGDGDVAAPRSVLVLVVFVDGVSGGFALVPVALVLAVQVAVVDVVDVVVVGDGDVAAARSVLVFVIGMGVVGGGVCHEGLLPVTVGGGGGTVGQCRRGPEATRFQ